MNDDVVELIQINQNVDSVISSLNGLRRILFGFCVVLISTFLFAWLDVMEKRRQLAKLPAIESEFFDDLRRFSAQTAVLFVSGDITNEYADWQDNLILFLTLVDAAKEFAEGSGQTNEFVKRDHPKIFKFARELEENQKLLIDLEAEHVSGNTLDQMPGVTASILPELLIREYDLESEFSSSHQLIINTTLALEHGLNNDASFLQHWQGRTIDELQSMTGVTVDGESLLELAMRSLKAIQSFEQPPPFLWNTHALRSSALFGTGDPIARKDLLELQRQLVGFEELSVSEVTSEKNSILFQIETAITGQTIKIPILDVAIPFAWLPWASLVFILILLQRYRKLELGLAKVASDSRLTASTVHTLNGTDSDYWFRNASGLSRQKFFFVLAIPVVVSTVANVAVNRQLTVSMALVVGATVLVLFFWDLQRMDERVRRH